MSNSETAKQLLSFILKGDEEQLSKLKDLKLAPLCDGHVASFQGIYCAVGSDRSALAQRVLKQLLPKETMDLTGLDVQKVRENAKGLELRIVESCEDLAKALLATGIQAAAVERSLLTSIEETIGGSNWL